MLRYILILICCAVAVAQNPPIREFRCTDTGSANALACSVAVCPASYAADQMWTIKAANANTTTTTVNFCALGVKTIKKPVNGITTDLASGDIRAGQYVQLRYDGTNMQMQSLLGNAAAGSSSSQHTILYQTQDVTITGATNTHQTWATYDVLAADIAVNDIIRVEARVQRVNAGTSYVSLAMSMEDGYTPAYGYPVVGAGGEYRIDWLVTGTTTVSPGGSFLIPGTGNVLFPLDSATSTPTGDHYIVPTTFNTASTNTVALKSVGPNESALETGTTFKVHYFRVTRIRL